MDLLPESTAAIQKALEVLRQGGVVAHATETCYGLACDMANKTAVERLFAVKQRPLDQPVSALFSSVDAAKEYVAWNEEADKYAEKFLPGPLTLILPMRSDAPRRLFPTPHGGDTIGVRVSSHPLAMELAARFGSPITTTSANVHGESNPYSAEDIRRQFQEFDVQPDLVIDSGPLPSAPPSTVMDCTGRLAKIRRQGDLPADA